MSPPRSLENRPVPGTFEKAIHWAALIGAFILLGGILMVADNRPPARHATLKSAPLLEQSR